MRPSRPRNSDQPVRSRFADDPAMKAIVARFAAALPERSGHLQQALLEANLEELHSLAHQLKGTAGGYGFDTISSAAADLERDTLSLEADLAMVREHVEDITLLCTAASRA